MDKSKDIKGKKVEVKKPEPRKGEKKIVFPFNRQNYILVITGLGFLVVGFILMIGGGSENPKDFSTTIFNFRRLTLSPILLFIGYIIEIYAIMKLPKSMNNEQ